MSCSSSSGSEEEEEEIDSYRKGGYHAVRIGDSFNGGRYIAQRKLGWGQFSTVWLAYDKRNSQYVALKIQKSAPQFAQAALHEIEVLSAIANGDPTHSKCVAQLIDHFKHSGPNGQHLCMVLEFLGDSLLRLIRYNHHSHLDLNKVREICKCVLIGLDYLHRELKIIHTDLKPENILLISPIDPSKDPVKSGISPILERPEGGSLNGGATMTIIEKKLKKRAKRAVARISSRRSSMGGVEILGQNPKPKRSLEGIDMRCKVVDFGNACWMDKPFTEEIQTRQYRAPEVILQAGYSTSADMWSFACTAFELATGEMLFAPKGGDGFSEDEALLDGGCVYCVQVNYVEYSPVFYCYYANISREPLTNRLFDNCHVSSKDHLALMMELLGKMPKKLANGGAKSRDYFDRYGDLKRIKRLKYWSLDRLLVEKFEFSDKDAQEFADFLRPILDFAPEKRPTAQQCLKHPWLNQNLTPNDSAGGTNKPISKVNK